MKKTWIRPEIILLVKGTSEESVLCHCKRHDMGEYSGPYGNHCPSTSECKTNQAS